MAESAEQATPSTAPVSGDNYIETSARERIPLPETQPAEAAAPPETPPTPSFDRTAWLEQYRTASEDERKALTDALIQEEPIRQTMSAENSRAIARANQRAEQEREQREALERDLILADENHEQHYEYEQQYGTAGVEAAKARVGLRAAIERPEVRMQANAEAAWNILQAVAGDHGLSESELRECFAGDPAENPNAGRDGMRAFFRRAIEADRKTWEPQARQHAVDDFRARVMPSADLGGSQSARPSPGLTNERLREMRRTNDPALATIPSSEIDRLVAETLQRAQT